MTFRRASPTLIEDALTAGADFKLYTPMGGVVSFRWGEVEPARDMPHRYEGWTVELCRTRTLDIRFVVHCSDIRVHDLEGAPEYTMRLDLVDSDLTYCKELYLPYKTRLVFGFDEAKEV